MNIKKMACAAAVLGCVAAATAADEAAEAEKGEVEEEAPIVSAEFGLQFDSKYMTYGVVDGKDPILTPSAQITFVDWLYFGVESIFDVTKGNGKRGDYGNRAGRWTTLDAIVGIAHEFELTEDIDLSVDANYIYEYLRRHHSDMGDTQYINLELGLTGLWLEPTLVIERDLMADDGTYVNFSLAHTFTLVGDDDDPTLTFTPSVGQGFGNTQRTRGYELAATMSRSRPTSPTATTGSTRSSATARVPTTARGATATSMPTRGTSTAESASRSRSDSARDIMPHRVCVRARGRGTRREGRTPRAKLRLAPRRSRIDAPRPARTSSRTP